MSKPRRANAKAKDPSGALAGIPKVLFRWRELNGRRRAYLQAVYRADQEEAWECSAWSSGQRAAPPRPGAGSSTAPSLVESSLRIRLELKDLVDLLHWHQSNPVMDYEKHRNAAKSRSKGIATP